MKKILLIEDDQVLRDNTVEFLKEEGFDTYSAIDGAVGVQLALEVVPDLILCDISMPKMDGYGVLKTLQSVQSTSTIPFIFLTAKTQKDDIRLGMHLGVDDYIPKPYTYKDLLTSIKTRLAKSDRLAASYEAKFVSLIENPLLGVFILQNEKFSYVNSKLVKILGYDSDTELYKKSFADIVDKKFIASVNEEIELSRKGLFSSQYFRVSVKTAKEKIIKVAIYLSIIKINDNNNIIGYVLHESNDNYFEQLNEGDTLTENITEAICFFLRQHNIRPNELIKIIRKECIHKGAVNPDDLTKREIEIIRQMAAGLSNKEIADKLFVSQRTIDSHKVNILSKTGVKHTAALMIYAIKNCILEE